MNEDLLQSPFGLGAVPSPHDYRDIPLTAVLGQPQSLPDSYFVEVDQLPIWNQKKIGSCTGHAGAKYKQKMEFDELKQVIPFSPRFSYALAKCLDDYAPEGTYPRLIMKIGQQYGFATEATVPNNCDLTHEEYVYNRDKKQIPQEAFTEAIPYRIKSYAVVGTSSDELKQAIVQAGGAMILMVMGSEWWTAPDGHVSWAAQDILPIRRIQSPTGRHEVYLYGYDQVDGKDRFHFVNCWSNSWGDWGKGNFMYEDHADRLIEAITAIDLPDDLLDKVHTLPPESQFSHYFAHDIEWGESGTEVEYLQTALNILGILPLNVRENSYGEETRKAVLEFDIRYQVATPEEIQLVNGKRVGAKARNQLNQLFNK